MAEKRSGLFGNDYWRLQQVGLVVVLMSARRLVRFVVIGVFVLGLLWLLYTNVWHSLRQEVLLPPGVASDPPRLDIEALRSINTARAARVEWTGRDFSAWGEFFAGSLEQPAGEAGAR